MNDKSYVSMEQHQCVVCGAIYDTGSILLDIRLKNSLENHTLTGQGMCPEHQKLKNEGYIALVVVTNEKTKTRSGEIVHIRSSVWENIFNVPVPQHGVAYIPPEVLTQLQAMMPPVEPIN